MQKIVNVLALASAAVSLAVVGTVGYVFVNKDAIIKGVTDKAMESVLGGGLGGLGGGAAGGALDVPDFGGPKNNDLSFRIIHLQVVFTHPALNSVKTSL